MPDDVGDRPFPDGDEPEGHSHGEADEEFAAVVFDEDFVRSAPIHEPTAVERMLAAAQARADADAAARGRPGSRPGEEEVYDPALDPDAPAEYGYGPHPDEDDGYGPYGPYGGSLRPYRSQARWHRPVAWVLAVVMGIGMVALAFAAVYRGTSGHRQDPAPPPATSGVDGARVDRPGGQPGALPSVPAGTGAPTASAVPRSQ